MCTAVTYTFLFFIICDTAVKVKDKCLQILRSLTLSVPDFVQNSTIKCFFDFFEFTLLSLGIKHLYSMPLLA